MVRCWCLIWIAAAMLQAQSGTPHFGRGVWRGNVVDFRIYDGWAIVEGDIIAGRASDLTARYAALLRGGTEGAPKTRQLDSLVVGDSARLWPAGVVPYEVDPAIKDTTQLDAAIQHWNQRTTLKIVPRDGQANYFKVTPFADPTICASSTVGMQGGVQQLYASELCGANLLIHEIGHVIGLSHEQARADRDRYLRLLWENMSKPGQSQYGVSVPSTDFGPYDYYSIMHYRGADFSRNAQPTMETRPPGIPIGQSLVLSDGDIDAVNRLYGNPPAAVTISSTPPGLQLIVDGETIVAPRAFDWAPGSTHTVEAPDVFNDDNGRYEFARWSDDQPRVHTVTAKPESVTLYTANFVRYNKFNLRVTPAGAGAIVTLPASADGYYRDDTRVTFAAIPAEGYVFANWTGPFFEHNLNLANLPTNPVTFFVDGDFQGFTARFVPAPNVTPSARPVTRFTSQLTSGGPASATIRVDGRVYATPVGFLWEPGSTHDVELASSFPVSGDFSLRQFQGWSDGTAEAARQIVAGDQAATYTGAYQLQYLLSAATVGSGRVIPNPASATNYFDQGSTVTLSAASSGGSQFIGWGQELGGVQNPKSVVMKESVNGIAFFGAPTAVSNFAVMNTARQRPNTQITGNAIFAKISPGEVVTVSAPGLGPDSQADFAPDGQGNVLTRLAETRVLLGGVAVPVLSAVKGLVTAYLPFGISVLQGQAVGIAVEYQGRATTQGALRVVASNPAIYTADGSGSGAAKVQNEDGSDNSADSPAKIGSVITFTATGLGVPATSVVDGRVLSSDGPAPKGELEVRVGGAVCERVQAVLAPNQLGVYRISARIPDTAAKGAATPLILTVDGAPSQFDLTVAVQ